MCRLQFYRNIQKKSTNPSIRTLVSTLQCRFLCVFRILPYTHSAKRRAVFPKQIEGAGTNDRYVFSEDAGKYASVNSSNTDKCAACGLSDNPISRQNGLDPFCQLRHLPQPANPFGFAGNTYCTAYFPGLYRGVVRKGG